ncbi:Probable acyl-CoA dehydrogenase [Heterostelium album PN500]|uniref:Probable acyl-CoA dehydrogenase n=1 Tax=Heterostelium pallidum (strain ATCC 26659 / Pp 5 / PN500) TaxID=670386 RepID=D3BSE5_HETP5|nr:Probable acyl-CoA dehydrogenase [Heterostelium album PN500]EFA75651.1 Probable acyl-CoA dehydrogenase [Heterostelium album PN500]|eukprot:XP_020427785.1 Probable acyl-CoA dehydrogenase [Heterostelium album PN500]
MSTENITTSSKQKGQSGYEYFQQEAPRLGNQYLEDSYLIESLKRVVPSNYLNEIEPDLVRFGDRVMGDILEYGRACENNPPKHVAYDAWGRRIDKIVVDEGWNILKDISAVEGLVSIGYERKQKEFSRLYQYLKIYLFACSSAVFDCPLSMTDGGARLLELYGDKELMTTAYPHYVTRDPKNFWTSGQWMTEKTGGSDVANSESVAEPRKDGSNRYDISGYKYFTSATTAQTAMILARDREPETGGFRSGSRGLSAFFIKIRKDNGKDLNNMMIHKMKNKFGTKAVPTTEIELLGTEGVMIGNKGRGVPIIASILNITRIHNVIHSVATMRRGVALARDFAHRRKVFGSSLAENQLYISTLAEMEIEYRAGLQFLLNVSLLLGQSECLEKNPKIDSLLRILTPLSKLYTAKQSILVSSETIECMGGTGYMEDSDIPRLLRDTQVTAIWEGTTNVLSMDVWRSIKSHNSLVVLLDEIRSKTAATTKAGSPLANAKQTIENAVKAILEISNGSDDLDFVIANAKKFSFLLSQTYMAALLYEHALWSKKSVDEQICERWCFIKLQSSKMDGTSIAFAKADQSWRDLDRLIALDIDESGNYRGTGDTSTCKRNFGALRARY